MARQLAAYHEALNAGMPRFGWKVGFNTTAVQERLGLSGPVAGWLDGRRVLRPGDVYNAPAGSSPRFEAEAAILVSADVPPGSSLETCRSALGGIAPAFEFVDASKPLSPLDEMLAHDILHEATMVGAAVSQAAASNLVEQGFPRVSVNGQARAVGLPGRYPADLAEIVLAVAEFLGAHGERLAAGDVIIGGSFIDPFDLTSGDLVEADFGPLGKMAVTVA